MPGVRKRGFNPSNIYKGNSLIEISVLLGQLETISKTLSKNQIIICSSKIWLKINKEFKNMKWVSFTTHFEEWLVDKY